MRIYWVLFGIFCINAAMVNSMGVPGTGVFESMTRTKRADEKPEHEEMSIGSPTAKRSDIEIKSTKPEKDHPSKEPHLKPSTPSKLHETLRTTTSSTPISMTTMTMTTTTQGSIGGPTTSTHKPMQKKPTNVSKVTVQAVDQHPQVPQSPYQIVPSAAVNQHFGLPLPFNPVHNNPEQFELPQNSNEYRENRIPHARSAYEDYNLGSTYQVVPSYHQEAPSYHQSSPATYTQPTVYSHHPEYQPPCGSNVLISCQPSVQQSPCSSYQPSYHVAAPSYHVGFPSYHNYHQAENMLYAPQPLPNSSYREAERNEMLVEEPLVGRTHHHHHRHHLHQHHHHQTTQAPETLDPTTQAPEILHPTKAQLTESDSIGEKTEKIDSQIPDVVKHLDVPDKAVKDDNSFLVGAPSVTNMPMDTSTTEDPSQKMRQMQSGEISKKAPVQTDQQAESSQMPSNQMSSSMMQSGQQMPLQIPSDQMQGQQMEISQMHPDQMQAQQMIPQQMMNMPMNSLTLQRQQMEIPQMLPVQMQVQQMIPQQMMNMPMNSLTLQRPQMEIPQMLLDQMQGRQMIPQQIMNMEVNPLTLDPMLINPVNRRPVHEFDQLSSDGPMLGMLNPMMDDSASQSAGGSPQQMFWEPTGLYYQLI